MMSDLKKNPKNKGSGPALPECHKSESCCDPVACLLSVVIMSLKWAVTCFPQKHWDHPITTLHASSQIRSNTANGNHKAALLGPMSPPSNPNFSWVACRAARSAAASLTVHCCVCAHPTNNSTIVRSPCCLFSSGVAAFSFCLSYLNSACTYCSACFSQPEAHGFISTVINVLLFCCFFLRNLRGIFLHKEWRKQWGAHLHSSTQIYSVEPGSAANQRKYSLKYSHEWRFWVQARVMSKFMIGYIHLHQSIWHFRCWLILTPRACTPKWVKFCPVDFEVQVFVVCGAMIGQITNELWSFSC